MTNQNISERGQALVIIAIAIIGLVAMAGLVIDGGNLFSDRRHAQNASDAAVLATSLHMVRGNSWDDSKEKGEERAISNGYDDNDAATTVELHNPPISGEYAGDPEYVQVIIISNIDTFFASVIGIDQLTNRVTSVVRVRPVTPGPLFEGSALVGLSPNGCEAFKFSGNATTTITGGGLYVNSDCPVNAFHNASGAGNLTADHMCVVGGAQYTASVDITLIEEGCDPVGYPPDEIVLPIITCASAATQSGNELSPGYVNNIDFPVDNGQFPPPGIDTLLSGVYCVRDGEFRLNATDVLEGHDVTISVETGGIVWNGGAEINLDAPDSGPYEGLLIFLPLSNSSPIELNGNSTSTWEGLILAPASHIKINGTGDGSGSMSSQIIGYTIELAGNENINITYNADTSWSGGVPPKLEFVE